jgi:5-formaminoimidazole-4-carboxamide-1-(beta)-D-ribofuranosyl 5'-monophosphate synthetase
VKELSRVQDEINGIIEDYDLENIRIGVLGSHSALEVAYGAKRQRIETVVVCQKGRERTYTHYYRNLFDHVILVDKFQDIIRIEEQEKLQNLNTIFIPNRSFSVYVGYDNIENHFKIPMLGNRWMLRTEERDIDRNQYYLLEKARIKTPKRFKNAEEIDRLVIVKVPEMKRKIERAFFYAASPKEYHEKAEKRIQKRIITQKDLDYAIIEEFVLGAKFNANYFWSPLVENLDLLGFDRRIQTDFDGFLDLPAEHQLELDTSTQNIEIGHRGATMRESQIEKIFDSGEKFVQTCREEYPPGMIGLFALQGAITKELEFYVFDVSPRVPGCPCVEPTSPYMKYKYLRPIGPGERVAMELKLAAERKVLERIVT